MSIIGNMLKRNETERFARRMEAKTLDNYAKAMERISLDYDYGLAGAQGEDGHYTDLGKLPWHPTFSNESAYASEANPGGVWGKAVDGQDTYTPSPESIRNGNTVGLAEYMSSKHQEGSKLELPAPYASPTMI